MPSSAPDGPAFSREPVRQRGRLRVAAVLDAASAAFCEKGFAAVTMTEIAARSGTAIGSLYRFFPTKEGVADALLAHYQRHIDHEIGSIAERASSLSASALADALVDFAVGLVPQYVAAHSLANERGVRAARCQEIRATVQQAVARSLVAKGLSKRDADAIAPVMVGITKMVIDVNADGPAGDARLVAEIRILARLYLSARLEAPRGKKPGVAQFRGVST